MGELTAGAGGMPLVSTNQHGASYQWGFEAADAPTITGFVARTAEVRYEPEVVSEAKDGEGHTDAIAISKPNKRIATGTFTGYINENWNPESLPEHFTWEGRKWFILSASEPRKKGEFVEVSLEVKSWPNVT